MPLSYIHSKNGKGVFKIIIIIIIIDLVNFIENVNKIIP